MSEAAVVAVREEKARIGNIEVTKETVLVATEEGIVVIERHRIEEHQPRIVAIERHMIEEHQPRMKPAPRPAPLPQPRPQVIHIRQSRAPEYAWYNPQDKGCCVGFLLVLMWILICAIALPLCILACLWEFVCGKDND